MLESRGARCGRDVARRLVEQQQKQCSCRRKNSDCGKLVEQVSSRLWSLTSSTGFREKISKLAQGASNRGVFRRWPPWSCGDT